MVIIGSKNKQTNKTKQNRIALISVSLNCKRKIVTGFRRAVNYFAVVFASPFLYFTFTLKLSEGKVYV